jgi:predicted nucleic acid-binding protein
MAIVLADTNIWLRAVDPNAAQYELATRALEELARVGHGVNIAPQILTEFLAVVTRPKADNGLGWSTVKASSEVRQLWDCFPMLWEPPQTLALWLELVERQDVKGKRTHDAKLAALMEANRVKHLLTFNAVHFASFPNVIVLDPAKVASGEVIVSD